MSQNNADLIRKHVVKRGAMTKQELNALIPKMPVREVEFAIEELIKDGRAFWIGNRLATSTQATTLANGKW